MKKEILKVTVIDLETGNRYSEKVEPYNKNVKEEQIETSKKRLVVKNKLSKENCKTEYEIETE